MQVRYAKTMALLAFAGVMGMASTHSAMGQSDRGARALEGTWLVQVSQQDCNSGEPVGRPFQSLLTFAQGGTMTETTSNPAFFPAVRTAGHGVWKHAGRQTYKASTTAFITLNGALARIQTINQTIEVLTEDSLRTTEASVTFYRPDGTVLASGCAAATGQRIELTE